LAISAPKNHFPLAAAPRTLLLAGGIGITPLLAMAETLAARDAAFDLHYCARSASLAAFRERMMTARFADRVHFYFDDAPAGTLDMAALLAQPDPDTHLYVCGPAGFIEHVLATARQQGWAQSQLHVEYFAGTAVDTSGDGAFDVELASSGKVVTIPAGRTVIQVLAEHGVDIPYSCEEGVCGTCLTRVLDGVPEHRDVYLTDEEHAANDQFTPCCSRARSRRLVLDL
jgi:vanillate O-demethylase ferredoxin subunit